ncbi:MAG: hypothetical protein WBF45_01380, partial [Acidobacteriaceae bacterium]
SQLRPKLNESPPDKVVDLLAIKKKLGLPDPRLRASAEPGEKAAPEAQPNVAPARNMTSYETNELVVRLTAEIDAFLNRSE